MNKSIAEKILLEFVRVVDKGFLCYGSALGAIREKGVIEHDLDVDVGIYDIDFTWNIVNKLLAKGFLLGNVFGMKACGLELSFSKEGIKVDLMVVYKNGIYFWNSLWDKGGRNGLNDMIIHKYKPFTIIEIPIHGINVRCAGKDYVKQVYGLGYQTPVKEWNWRTDHHCINENLKHDLKKLYG